MGQCRTNASLVCSTECSRPSSGSFRPAYQFGVLEDFDHLYRYANLYELIEHRQAEKIVDALTEVMPSRPTKFHHRHPIDNVREPYDRTSAPRSPSCTR